MEMLMKWIEPTIKERVDQVAVAIETEDQKFIQENKDFYTSFHWLEDRIPAEHHEQLRDLEFFMTRALERATELAYRSGLKDGMKLHQDMQKILENEILQ